MKEEGNKVINFNQLWDDYNKIKNKLPKVVRKWAGKEERYDPCSNYTIHDARLLELDIERDSGTSDDVTANIVFAGPFAYNHQFIHRKVCRVDTTINQMSCNELNWDMLKASYDTVGFDEEKKKVIHCIYFHQGHISITCADILCQFIANERGDT